jgi:hypothetical protein
MTDKNTDHPLKKMAMSAVYAQIAFIILLGVSVLAQPASAAEQEWWFDVEVILFERNVDAANISEKFKQSRLKQASKDYHDLLTPYLKPDLSYLRAALPYCRASNQLAVKKQYEQGFFFPVPLDDKTETSLSRPNEKSAEKITSVESSTDVELIEWQIPSKFPCAFAEQIDASFASLNLLQNDASNAQQNNQIKRVPEIINGIEWQKKRSAFLLPASSMQMSDLYDKIKRQRDITPILHINWRQEVKFGRENGQTFRLFAGENFADQFDANGLHFVDDTDTLFDSLNQATDDIYIPEQVLALLNAEQQLAVLAGNNVKGSETITEDLFARIATALADDTPINFNQIESQTEQAANIDPAILKELWKLDGGINVYLRNVGRVPYLHIDSNLEFRHTIFDPQKASQVRGLSTNFSDQGALTQTAIVGNQIQPSDSLQPNFLQSVNFNQLRRVISKQVHYFDHPLFGMVVRINRYRWPEVDKKTEQGATVNNSQL